jgi:endonuclease III
LLKTSHKKRKNMIEANRSKSDSKINAREQHRLFLLRNIDTIAEILEALYNSPNHGNKSKPIDELIFIHLSKKTNEKSYTEAFNRLSSAFPNWYGLVDAKPEYVENLIASAGLGKQRTEELLANCKKIIAKFGQLSLNQMYNWNTKKIFKFLTSLSGIGPKSAYCIMMYSLNKEVFPVDTHVHSICERMGFIDNNLDHDQAQKVLSELFPKRLRYSLHVNMVAHGRKICRRQGRPLCERCNLSKFCLMFRNTKRISENGVSMVDFFCGAGGASVGLKEAGFQIRLAVDNSQKAIDTYYVNNEELSFDEIITSNLESLGHEILKQYVDGEITLMFGGPPCQGWSQIGKNRKNGKNGNSFLEDPKNRLYEVFAKQLDIIKPRYFVMENVPALAAVHDGKYAWYLSLVASPFVANSFCQYCSAGDASTFMVETSPCLCWTFVFVLAFLGWCVGRNPPFVDCGIRLIGLPAPFR